MNMERVLAGRQAKQIGVADIPKMAVFKSDVS